MISLQFRKRGDWVLKGEGLVVSATLGHGEITCLGSAYEKKKLKRGGRDLAQVKIGKNHIKMKRN